MRDDDVAVSGGGSGGGGGGERLQATATCRRINSSAQFMLFFLLSFLSLFFSVLLPFLLDEIVSQRSRCEKTGVTIADGGGW